MDDITVKENINSKNDNMFTLSSVPDLVFFFITQYDLMKMLTLCYLLTVYLSESHKQTAFESKLRCLIEIFFNLKNG